MDFVPSICLSSLAGAVLFFTGGRLSSRGPGPDDPAAREAAEQASARAAEELRGAWQSHQDAVRALADERGRSADLRRELEAERAHREQAARAAAAEVQRFGDEGGRLRAQAAEIAEQLAALRARSAHEAGELGRARAQIAASEARATAAEQRVAVVATELEKARREHRDAVEGRKRAEGELGAMRARLDAARVELVTARADAALREAERARLAAAPPPRAPAGDADLAEVQRARVELAMRARVLDQRAGEMERKDAENAELRGKVEALGEAAREAATLRRRVLDLEARGFARQLVEATPAARPTRPTGEAPQLEVVLSQGLAELVAQDEGCRTAVLSDLRGLLIASAGDLDHEHEIAAAASLTTHAAERLRELLPLGEPQSLELRDENGLVVRTRWLRWEHERFLLSTLGAAPPAGRADLATSQLTARIAALIGGA